MEKTTKSNVFTDRDHRSKRLFNKFKIRRRRRRITTTSTTKNDNIDSILTRFWTRKVEWSKIKLFCVCSVEKKSQKKKKNGETIWRSTNREHTRDSRKIRRWRITRNCFENAQRNRFAKRKN